MARAALQFAREHPAIDADQVGILGHSEGGAIAPQIAVENPGDVAFIVSMAGTALPGDDVPAVAKTAASWRPAAQPPKTSSVCLNWPTAPLRWSWQKTLRWKRPCANSLNFWWRSHPKRNWRKSGDLDAYYEQQSAFLIDAYNADWYRYFLGYDPGVYWPEVDLPVLALFGGLDVQVSAEDNAEALRAMLGEDADLEIITFTDANHLFQQAVTGTLEEYGDLEPEFVPALLPTISDWLLARVTLATE